MDPTQIVHTILRMLRRRAILIALVCVVGVALSAFVAVVLPARYETSARILVESQQIPDELARSTVTSTALERLKLIEQRLMAHDSVAALIKKLDLYANQPDMTLNEKVDALRAATAFESEVIGPTNWGSGVSVSAFSITVTYGDPTQAAAIANELVSSMLQQNLQTRTEQTRDTLRFFDEERDRLSEQIRQIDGEIAVFKTENEALLPETLDFRRSEIGRLVEANLEVDRRILALEEQRNALQAGLRDDAVGVQALSPEETTLRQLETELAQKRPSLAESHPEIRELRRRIEAMRAIVGQGPSTEADGTEAEGAALSPRARATQRQIDVIDSQIALLEEQRRATEVRRAETVDSLQLTPAIETTLAVMTRRRTELLGQYDSIIRKRDEAETGERLEVSQQAERFEVIENALPPEGPVAPKRKKLLVLGSGASLAFALGLAFLIEKLNPAIRSSAEFQRQLAIEPRAARPYGGTRRARLRRQASIALAAVFVLAVPAGLWAIDRHVRPIQSLLDAAVEKSGVDGVIQSVRQRL